MLNQGRRKVQKTEGGGEGGTNNRIDCLFLLRFSFLNLENWERGQGMATSWPSCIGNVDRVASEAGTYKCQ